LTIQPLPTSDRALLEAARHADRAAMTALVETWGFAVLQWCTRLGGPGVDAEDAAQDVFVALLQDLGALRDPVAFPAWLMRVTRRVVARRRRSAWFRRVVGWSSFTHEPHGDAPSRPEEADPHGGPDANLERADDARVVLEILDDLPARLREVLVLCELESRTEAEAATLLGIPLGTVKSRTRRAREVFTCKARFRGLLAGSGTGREVEVIR
jgi:RNA polymerase sigma-70 factor, ECF subfamily